jgi:Bacterial Ig-like domain (group 3)
VSYRSVTRLLACAAAFAFAASLLSGFALADSKPSTNAPSHQVGPRLNFAVGRNGSVHVMLTHRGAATAAGAYRSVGASPFAFPHTLLPYNGGPVMRTNHVYTIFWLPSGYHYGDPVSDANYENLINQFFDDLSGSQYYDILTQYPDLSGPLTHTVSHDGSYVDTTAYPCGSTCGTHNPGQNLSDTDIQNEVLRATQANAWQPGQTNQYLVFYAAGVQSCTTFGCSHSDFCAYHGQFTGSNGTVNGQWIYSNMYDGGADAAACGLGNGSPADQVASDTTSAASHEMSEATTDLDPLAQTVQGQAWQNAAAGPSGFGGEIGDLCAYVWKGATVMNGHSYAIQSEWSNYDADCVTGDSIPTSVAYTGPTTGTTGSIVTLTATLHDGNSAGVGEQTVKITLGSQFCTGKTDFAVPGTSLVHASCQITLGQPPGSYTVAAHYPGGIGAYQPSDSTGTTFTIEQRPTTLSYTGPTSADYNDQFTATAKLTDTATSAGIANETVTFVLGAGTGTETCSGSTDSSGVAQCPLTPNEAAGSYTITASFAGDTTYLPSSDQKAFTITKEETTTAYTGPTVLLGSSATLQGTLLEDGTTPIAGRTLTLGVGGVTCTTPPTDANGVASCTVSTSSLGSQTLTASFAGDAYYLPSGDSTKTATVFAFPSSGAFALGDLTVAGAGSSTVTWWSSQWSSMNSLSGGAAPAAFKGFASVVTLPTTSPANVCSGDWTSSGGNSPPPPATVPSYMGVIVPTKITKSGSTIEGNYVKIVVVKTNPGYAPDPANRGTGTIVATFCP